MTEISKRGERSPVPAEWTYAPAPESRDIVRLRERYGLYVGGEWLEAAETYATMSPSTEETLGEVGQAGDADVRRAVETAGGAFENGWSSLPGSKHAKHLFRIARILQERA